MPNMEKLLGPKDVADLLGVSEWHARDLMKRVGEVPQEAIGKKCRVRPADLDAYLTDPEGYVEKRAASACR